MLSSPVFLWYNLYLVSLNYMHMYLTNMYAAHIYHYIYWQCFQMQYAFCCCCKSKAFSLFRGSKWKCEFTFHQEISANAYKKYAYKLGWGNNICSSPTGIWCQTLEMFSFLAGLCCYLLWPPVICLSVNFPFFIFFTTTGPISTKLGAKHPEWKGSTYFLNKGPMPFLIEDNSKNNLCTFSSLLPQNR